LIGGIIGEIEKLSEGFSISNSNSQFVPPPSPVKPDMLGNRLFSYYLQFSYELINKLSLVGGIRHDFSSYYGQVLTPRVGLVFNTSKFTAKFMYNRAFRAPKPWDYGYGSGNESLKPEKMHSFELFTSYSILKNLSVGASLYRNLINDKLTLDYSGGGVRWVNENKLNTFGFEFYGNYSTKSLSLYANYTYTNSYEHDGIIIPEISMHTANAGITYAFTPHIRANLRANYIGGRNNPMLIPSTGNNKIDGAFLLHGAISYSDFYGFDIQLKVNNFFNEEYYHPSNRFSGRYRQPQKSVMLMITYNLFR
jgi:outer membrane cobalamin receptor